MTLEEARQALEDAGLYARISETAVSKTRYLRVGTGSMDVGGIQVIKNCFHLEPENQHWFVRYFKWAQGCEERYASLTDAVGRAIEHARSLHEQQPL